MPTSSPDVIDRVQAALTRALAALAERAVPEGETTIDRSGWQQGLARFQEHFQALEQCSRAAGARVAAVEAELLAGEQALRTWLNTAEAARANLAEWVGRAVG
jgi:hypothetical protein